jgi:hypothetical protein
MSTQISITLAEEEGAKLQNELANRGVNTTSATVVRLTGQEILVTIFLPITLTAVQVAATFLASRQSYPPKVDKPQTPPETKKSPSRARARIRIGSVTIGEDAFSIELVEKKIGRKLDDR